MLNSFFDTTFPYGIEKNENGEWKAFNREYMPIGYNFKYKGLTEKLLTELAVWIERNSQNNKIIKIWLYDDGTNPKYQSKNWDNYIKKLKKLSRLEVKY